MRSGRTEWRRCCPASSAEQHTPCPLRSLRYLFGITLLSSRELARGTLRRHGPRGLFNTSVLRQSGAMVRHSTHRMGKLICDI